MKLSRFKLWSIVFVAVLFLCSQTVALACTIAPMPNIEFRCLDKMVATYSHIAEAYAIDKTLSSDPYLVEALRKDPLRTQRELDRLDPCYDDLTSIVALYDDAKAEISTQQARWIGTFRFTPTKKDAVINDEALWYQTSSCRYPWRMKTDEWLATTYIIKSYCTGSLVDSMCQNTLAPSMEFFALEVAGLRETNMPESVRQRLQSLAGDSTLYVEDPEAPIPLLIESTRSFIQNTTTLIVYKINRNKQLVRFGLGLTSIFLLGGFFLWLAKRQ